VGAFLYGPVHGFMVWNLFLAAVPVALAGLLFRRHAHHSYVWWCGLALWVLFLPNAPYVLTDVVHMVDDVQVAPSRLHAYEVLVLYAAFYGAGLTCYVISLQRFRRHMHRVAPSRIVLPVMLGLHGLCVVGMYLGRFLQLNSWDAVLAPGAVVTTVLRVPRPSTVVLLALMFVVVGAGAFATAAVGEKVLAQLRRLAS
jgi:uncharacterized membrane protein